MAFVFCFLWQLVIDLVLWFPIRLYYYWSPTASEKLAVRACDGFPISFFLSHAVIFPKLHQALLRFPPIRNVSRYYVRST
jgi:hypothetical protein